jgi:hypothetical protein
MSNNNRILIYQELNKGYQKIYETINETLKKEIFKHDNIDEIDSVKLCLNQLISELNSRIRWLNNKIKQEEEVDKIFIEQKINK